MTTLLLLAEASWRALVTFFASVLLTAVVERHRPWHWVDVPLLLGGVAGLAWVVREIVQPRWTTSALHKFEKWRVPTTSGLSFIWDVALLSCAAALWNIGFGPTMFIVPAVLAMLRVVFWRRRPAAN